MSYVEVKKGWNTFSVIVRSHRRKDNFEPYTEPFRPLNDDEVKSITRTKIERVRKGELDHREVAKFIILDRYSEYLVSYQALTGGFTICNIIVNGRLFSGSSHCIKSDRWLPIPGKMNAFHRALQSEGVELPQKEKYFISDGLVYSSE